MTTVLPLHCPTCATPTNPARDTCSCGRSHCHGCGELLTEENPQ
jgi:hypothetical protein